MEHRLELPTVQGGRFGRLIAPRDQISVPSIHRPTQRIIGPQQFPAEVPKTGSRPSPEQDPERNSGFRPKVQRHPVAVQEPSMEIVSPMEIISPKENTLDRIGLTGLRENQMLHTLGDIEMPRILNLGHWITFDRDEIVSCQGTPVHEVMFLGAGSARAEISAPAVRESMAVLNYLKPGDDIGLLSLVDGSPHSATVVALERLLMFSIPIEKVRNLLVNHPEWYRILAEVAVWRLRNSSVWLQSLI